MKRLLFVIVAAWAWSPTYAQFSDSVFHHITGASSGTINQTNNSQAYILNNNIKFGINRKDISLNTSNSWVYGQQQRKLTNNDFSSVLDFNLYKTFPHFYYWGLANYTKSFSLKINNQAQIGLGVAYKIVDKKQATVNISDGVLYEQSNLYVNDSTNNIYSTYRNSLRVSVKLTIKELITLNSTNYIQNSFNSNDDYIIKSNTSLGIKLRKWLSLTTTYSYNRFNRTKSENILFTYGLTVDKYF